MKLQTVSSRKLYIQIADQLREQILSGAIRPGQQLPSERDLSVQLGVSRPTLREALIALEIAGLVEVRVGVGAFVQDHGRRGKGLPERNQSPIEIMAVRRLLEPQAAALASHHMGEMEKLRLKAIVAHMREETDAGEWSAESDRDLHMMIADACGNLILRDMIGILWASRAEDVDTRFHRHLGDISEVRLRIMDDHESIAAAVIAGDAQAAHTAMDAHLDYVEREMYSGWD